MFNQKAYLLGTNRSCIRELFEFGRQRAAIVGDENVFDYSLGNPSIPAPAGVNEAVIELLQTQPSLAVHGYTSSVGDLEARSAISADLNRRFGANTQPSEFFLGSGAAPLLTAAFSALAVEGGELLVVAPYFPEYKPFCESAGLKFRLVEADIPDFQIKLEAVEAMLTPDTQAILLNSPNNPSGVVYTRATLTALARLLEKKAAQFGHPIYIISDEPYRELAYGVEVPFLPLIYKDTILVYSWSKCLSIPGERIGYAYISREATDGPQVFAALAGAARSMGHVCAPSLWQKVIAKCAHLRPDLREYDRSRTLLYESLTAMGYETAKPDGAFYLFVKAPGGDAAAFSEKAKQKDLLIVPGADFGCPGYFRLCYCIPYDKIRRSLPIFRELIMDD